MNKDDILRVTQIYRKRLLLEDLDSISLYGQSCKHCYNMLDKIDKFIYCDIEKAFRWLGFTQGCLWTNKIYTIDELGKHNNNSL